MIKTTVLENGLKIISEYMPETYSATVMFWVDAGPNIESAEKNGISHFVEHMVFKGTKSRSSKEIVQTIENSGGSINAFTDKESTCYYAKVLKDQVSVAIDTIFDMLLNSVFDKKDMELEKKVILEEIRMYEDTPDELVYDVFMESYWPKHPLGRPISGTIKSVKSISRDDIIKFVEDYYTPDNIVISISGNFDEEAVLEQINLITRDINIKSKDKLNEIPIIIPDIIICNKDIEQAHLCIGFRGVPILDDDRYPLAIVDIALGGCMASRLFQEIREKRGLVYSINSFESLYRPSGIFGIYAGTNPSNIKEVMKLILDEIEKIKNQGLLEDEIEKAKSQLKGSMLVGLESTRYRASRNARSELYFNKSFDTQEICNQIDKVENRDILKIGNYVFDSKYMGACIVGKKKQIPAKLCLDMKK